MKREAKIIKEIITEANIWQIIVLLYWQGIIQAVSEVGNRFWAHQNWGPNFHKLAKTNTT